MERSTGVKDAMGPMPGRPDDVMDKEGRRPGPVPALFLFVPFALALIFALSFIANARIPSMEALFGGLPNLTGGGTVAVFLFDLVATTSSADLDLVFVPVGSRGGN